LGSKNLICLPAIHYSHNKRTTGINKRVIKNQSRYYLALFFNDLINNLVLKNYFEDIQRQINQSFNYTQIGDFDFELISEREINFFCQSGRELTLFKFILEKLIDTKNLTLGTLVVYKSSPNSLNLLEIEFRKLDNLRKQARI
jgi:hypothetical protein